MTENLSQRPSQVYVPARDAERSRDRDAPVTGRARTPHAAFKTISPRCRISSRRIAIWAAESGLRAAVRTTGGGIALERSEAQDYHGVRRPLPRRARRLER